MTKEKAIEYILEHASKLPVKEAMACHIAAGDLQEYGIEEWIEWSPIAVMDIFVGIAAESSANSLDNVKAHLIGEEFIDELTSEYILDNETQERMDVYVTMSNLRESMLEVFDAMQAYFEVQLKIREKYYGLY